MTAALKPPQIEVLTPHECLLAFTISSIRGLRGKSNRVFAERRPIAAERTLLAASFAEIRIMDVFTSEKRSQVMSRIRGKNTKPELVVRRLLHRLGYRFRLHAEDLPGKPDIVLPKYKTVVFVNGCFWHAHSCKQGSRRPASNMEFWNAKLAKNKKRDTDNMTTLKEAGWQCLVIWQCGLRDIESLTKKLRTAMPQVRKKPAGRSIDLKKKRKKAKLRARATAG